MQSLGWIKLHRSLTEWEWYQHPDTLRVFLHLLLLANHEDKKWQGIVIKRGQRVAGRKILAQELKISEKNVRTAITHLKSTNELASENFNKFTIYTVVNYNKYQLDGQRDGQQPASNRPATGQQPATNKNDKNDKNEKNISPVATAVTPEPPAQKGNEDLNLFLDRIKKETGLPATSGARSRQYAFNFLRALKKNYPEQNENELAARIVQIAVGLQDGWHSTKAHDPKHLFYNWQEIISKTKKSVKNSIPSFGKKFD